MKAGLGKPHSTSAGFGAPHDAMTHARTGYACADNAGHDGLRAWTRGLQANITYWSGRWEDSLRYAQLGTDAQGAQPAARYPPLVPTPRAARRPLAAGFTEIEVVISASDTHNRRNVNRSTAESLDAVSGLVDAVHGRGGSCQVIVATAFGCPYEGDVPTGRVVEVARRAVRAGADSVSFGDTTGMGTPSRVTRLVGEFRSALPDTPLNLHFHNTRGTGLANVLAALQLGVADFDASVGGLGGCPYAPGASGNIATEEFVHMVEDMGVDTGVDLEAIIDAARTAEAIVGRELPSQVLRAGPRTRLTPVSSGTSR